jgi:hypothetical protein
MSGRYDEEKRPVASIDLPHSLPAECPDVMLIQIARRLRQLRGWPDDRPVHLLVGGTVVTVAHAVLREPAHPPNKL